MKNCFLHHSRQPAHVSSKFLQTNFVLYVEFVLDAERMIFVMIFSLQFAILVATPLWTIALVKGLPKKVAYIVGISLVIFAVLVLLVVQPGMWYFYIPAGLIAGKC